MLRPIQPYIEYVLNQDYIAEFLCINKDKPELQCNGKCHLVKQIEKQQKNEPKSLRISIENYPIGFVNIYRIEPFKFYKAFKKANFSYSKSYRYNYGFRLFQPPDLV